jgi:hypothetical protein
VPGWQRLQIIVQGLSDGLGQINAVIPDGLPIWVKQTYILAICNKLPEIHKYFLIIFWHCCNVSHYFFKDRRRC